MKKILKYLNNSLIPTKRCKQAVTGVIGSFRTSDIDFRKKLKIAGTYEEAYSRPKEVSDSLYKVSATCFLSDSRR